MMADVKYEKNHYMEEGSGICGLLQGQIPGTQDETQYKEDLFNHAYHPAVEPSAFQASDFRITASMLAEAGWSLFGKWTFLETLTVIRYKITF